MTSSCLKEQLIRLGSTHPDLQDDIRPILDTLEVSAIRKGRGDGIRLHNPMNSYSVRLVKESLSPHLLQQALDLGRYAYHNGISAPRHDRHLGRLIEVAKQEAVSKGLEDDDSMGASSFVLMREWVRGVDEEASRGVWDGV